MSVSVPVPISSHTQTARCALFRQLYDALTYYRIRALKLLALLVGWRPGCEQCAVYLRRDRAEQIRCVAEQLRLDLRGTRPITEIARKNGMGLTAFKRDFACSLRFVARGLPQALPLGNGSAAVASSRCTDCGCSDTSGL